MTEILAFIGYFKFHGNEIIKQHLISVSMMWKMSFTDIQSFKNRKQWSIYWLSLPQTFFNVLKLSSRSMTGYFSEHTHYKKIRMRTVMNISIHLRGRKRLNWKLYLKVSFWNDWNAQAGKYGFWYRWNRTWKRIFISWIKKSIIEIGFIWKTWWLVDFNSWWQFLKLVTEAKHNGFDSISLTPSNHKLWILYSPVPN